MRAFHLPCRRVSQPAPPLPPPPPHPRWYPATVTRDRGRGCFDVKFDTGEKEAGVPLARLRSHTRVIPQVHSFEGLDPNGWPFVCAPLLVDKEGQGDHRGW